MRMNTEKIYEVIETEAIDKYSITLNVSGNGLTPLLTDQHSLNWSDTKTRNGCICYLFHRNLILNTIHIQLKYWQSISKTSTIIKTHNSYFMLAIILMKQVPYLGITRKIGVWTCRMTHLIIHTLSIQSQPTTQLTNLSSNEFSSIRNLDTFCFDLSENTLDRF